MGTIMQRAATLTNTPARPREKRSLASPSPFQRCQITQEMVITYEHVRETETREMMPLKPMALPKLMQVMTKVAAMTVQSAV